jgi:hypothetical protein
MEPGKETAPAIRAPRPEVIVEFLFERGVLLISIHNFGDAPAYNISVRFNEKLLGLAGTKEISALPIFKNIQFLGPKREITTVLDSSDSYFKSKQPTAISLHIDYHDSENHKYQTTINHDLEIYRDLTYLSSANVDDQTRGSAS